MIAAWLAGNASCGYIPKAGMSCPTRIRVFSGLPDQSRGVTPAANYAMPRRTHPRSEQRTRGTGAEHTIVPWVVVILTHMTNDTCVTTMTIVTCGALALRASKTRQGSQWDKNSRLAARAAHTCERRCQQYPERGHARSRSADRRNLGTPNHAEPAPRSGYRSLDQSDQ